MNLWRRGLWLLWLVILAVGATAAAQWGAHGSWYVGLSIGSAVGMATWFPKPGRRKR